MIRVVAVAVLLVLLLPGASKLTASPGGLDARGGHHRWTNCSRHGLYRGQYHCHRAPCISSDIAFHRPHGH